MKRYTNIGEAVVTSSLTGKARVRIVQNGGVRILMRAGQVVLVLACVAVLWLAWSGYKVEETDQPADVQVDSPAVETTPAPVAASEAAAPVAAAAVPGNPVEYARQLAQQGNYNESIEAYRKALLQEPGNDVARQAMVELLLKARRTADAERALQLGIKYNPQRTTYYMQLAHLQAGRGSHAQALDSLMKGASYAKKQADYQAFIASLLQRLGRHTSAVVYYKQALELQPGAGEWHYGMGVSLKAAQRGEEALEAFKKALASGNLSAQSQEQAEAQLKSDVVVPPVAAQPAVQSVPQ